MTTFARGNRQVILEGRGIVTLRQSDHIATGGEGSVFHIGADTVVKIYTDPQKMAHDDMARKIQALVVLQHPYIVAPQGLALNARNDPIGYYMPYVDGEAFPRIFITGNPMRKRFGDKGISLLASRMQEVVRFAHDHKALIVDGNELSWLAVTRQGPEPRIIDVDSWSIGRWPPTVIMPSIQDWHTKGFTQLTDWFAWGIVTFQLYTGIHPYKGTLAGYQRGELERRMRDNTSVFSTDVRLNANVRDFSCIPPKLLEWYRNTFQNGMREIPPSPLDVGVVVSMVTRAHAIVAATTGRLMQEKLYANAADPALRVFPCGIVMLQSGNLHDLASKQLVGRAKSHECEVIQKEGYWIIADWDSSQLEFVAIDVATLETHQLSLQVRCYHLLQQGNRLFAHTDQGLSELRLLVVGKPLLVSDRSWGVMRYSTQWFESVGIMDALGATFVIAPFGEQAVAQVRVKELDGLRPVTAKAGNRFVVIVAIDQKGEYRKLELTFDREYKTYAVWEGAVDTAELNMAVLPRGVAAIITQDGELNVFVPVTGALTKVQDRGITTDMMLGNWQETVVYIRDGEVWRMQMR